ncbi:PilZ domain-containing protein [Alginatibacterium sediminis]|uniref:PilZ domain-containing protein n=1 Tax=Alginatibacterium sediminis TaxID=2164068 RepID=A0A420EGG8_9ALTE|nr:PilZ domain-containing protein [Alginatibacterium sediminis]RKF19805.1 PilZ domain-containing protein [Alginatibacterium sediminis]
MEALTHDELDFIRGMFTGEDCAESPQLAQKNAGTQALHLSRALAQAKLSLGEFKLWFPIQFTPSDLGYLRPLLACPEVIDMQGLERCWRIDKPTDIKVRSPKRRITTEVLSISSTGLKMRCGAIQTEEFTLLELPQQHRIEIKLRACRNDSDTVAANIIADEHYREKLREYIFGQHQKRFPELY